MHHPLRDASLRVGGGSLQPSVVGTDPLEVALYEWLISASGEQCQDNNVSSTGFRYETIRGVCASVFSGPRQPRHDRRDRVEVATKFDIAKAEPLTPLMQRLDTLLDTSDQHRRRCRQQCRI